MPDNLMDQSMMPDQAMQPMAQSMAQPQMPKQPGLMEIDILISEKDKDVDLPELSETDKKVCDKVIELFDDWRTWFESNHKERIRSNYKRYNALIDPYDDVDDKWRGINGSPIRLAIEYSVVETYKTRCLKALIQDEFVKIIPTKTTSAHNAELMNKLVYFFLNEDDYVKKLITFLGQGLTYGSSPWFVYQKQLKQKAIQQVIKTRQEPVANMFGWQVGVKDVQYTEQVEVEETIENRPCWEIYDIENVGFHYQSGDYSKSPYYIFRQLMHRSELSKLYPDLAQYFNSGKLNWDGTDDYRSERQTEIGKQGEDKKSTEGMIECLYHLEPEGWIVIFGRKIIKRYANPTQARKKEVFTGMLNVLPKEFEPYGLDLITLESQFADIWNEQINNNFDSTKLSSSLMFAVKEGTAAHRNSFYVAPGNQWVVGAFDDFQPIEFKYDSGASMKLLEYISRKDQQITGASDITMGTTSNAEFATDIQRMQVESNYKFWLVLLHVRMELKKVMRAYVKHIQEFIAPTITQNNPFIFQVTGDNNGFDQQEINNPHDLEGEFDYRISLESNDTNEEIVRAQLIKAIQIITAQPQLAQFINPVETLKMIFNAFPKIKNLESLTISPTQQLMKILQAMPTEQIMQILGQINSLVNQKQIQEFTQKEQAMGKPGNPARPNQTVPSNQGQIRSQANQTGRTPTPTAGGMF